MEHSTFPQKPFANELCCCREKLKLDKPEEWSKDPIIFVVSSTGDGDPPENAEAFWRQLRRKTKSEKVSLEHVRFIILGLGDSNYDSYQGFPTALYAKLLQLGAKPIITLGKADEATSALEDYIEPWVTDLWTDLEEYFTNGTILEVGTHEADTKSAEVSDASKENSSSASTASAPNKESSTPAHESLSALSITPSAKESTANSTEPEKDQKSIGGNTTNQTSSTAGSITTTTPLLTSLPSSTTYKTSSEPSKNTENVVTVAQSASEENKTSTPISAATSEVPAASPAKSATPAPAKAARAPIVPKAPVHTSKIEFLEKPALSLRASLRNLRESGSSLTSSSNSAAPTYSEKPRFKPASLPPTKETPYLARITSYRSLTSPDAVKDVYEVTLKVQTGAEISPGEAIGIWPENSPLLIERMLSALSVEFPDRLFHFVPVASGDANPTSASKTTFPFQTPTTIRNALRYYVNFTGIVSKRLLVMLASYCTKEESKNAIMQLVTSGKEKFKSEIEDTYASVLDILERYPDCKPDVGHLFDSLSALMPRYFSLANFIEKESETGLLHDSGSLSALPPVYDYKFIFSVEKTVLPNKTFVGVATGWLKHKLDLFSSSMSREEDPQLLVPIFMRQKGDFVLPEDQERPIIMCGAGTGVSPFLGFLEQRRHRALSTPDFDTQTIGKAILFAGHRHPHMDWLYRSELEEFKFSNDSIHTAFSRLHPGQVEYVQDVIAKEDIGKELVDLMLNHDAVWYVCGDVRRMAAQVRETLLKLLQTHAGMDSKQSSDKVLEWAKGKRYLLDLWG